MIQYCFIARHFVYNFKVNGEAVSNCLGLYHSSEIMSPKIVVSRLKSP